MVLEILFDSVLVMLMVLEFSDLVISVVWWVKLLLICFLVCWWVWVMWCLRLLASLFILVS